MAVNKLLLVAAGAAGYVLGARAGRARYEQIRQHSAEVWNSGPVQRGVDAAGATIVDAAKQAGSAVVDRVSGDDEDPAPQSTPTAPASPPTAGDLDPNKHL